MSQLDQRSISKSIQFTHAFCRFYDFNRRNLSDMAHLKQNMLIVSSFKIFFNAFLTYFCRIQTTHNALKKVNCITFINCKLSGDQLKKFQRIYFVTWNSWNSPRRPPKKNFFTWPSTRFFYLALTKSKKVNKQTKVAHFVWGPDWLMRILSF